MRYRSGSVPREPRSQGRASRQSRAVLIGSDVPCAYHSDVNQGTTFAGASSSAESAQQVYKEMITRWISPALRELGFKGSGGKYSMTQGEWLVFVGFQRFTWSTRESVHFDANVAVRHLPTSEAFDLANREARKMGRAPENPPSYWSRLSRLIPDRPEHGWKVGPSEPGRPVAEEVISCVRERFLPVVRAEMGRSLPAPTPPVERPKRSSPRQWGTRTVDDL